MQRVGQLKGRVGIQCVKAVECVDQNAFGIPHMLQVSCGYCAACTGGGSARRCRSNAGQNFIIANKIIMLGLNCAGKTVSLK